MVTVEAVPGADIELAIGRVRHHGPSAGVDLLYVLGGLKLVMSG